MPDFQVIEGVMVFKNSGDFLKTLSIVSNMTIEEYNIWLTDNNFKSSESIFYEIMNAEAELTAYYETLPENEINIAELKDHSELALKYLKEGFIYERETDDSSSLLTLTTCNPAFSRLLNENNIVSFDNKIYQYNATNIKIITDNDFSKINLLNNTNATNNEETIVVNSLPKTEANYTWTNQYFYFGKNNKKRVHVTSIARQFTLTGTEFTTYYMLETYYEKYYLWKWRNASTTFTFKSNTWFKVQTTNSSNSTTTFTHYPHGNGNYSTSSSYVKLHYINAGYGGYLEDFIHTPHIYGGRNRFSLSAGASYDLGVTNKYLLK